MVRVPASPASAASSLRSVRAFSRNVRAMAKVKPEGIPEPVVADHETILKDLSSCGVSRAARGAWTASY